jgi:glycosyltransferase involved in cell wall biosynthesis
MNDNNRIAMFSIHSDPLTAIGSHGSGGQNVYVHDLALALDKKGWEIDIFTRYDDPRKKFIAKIGRHSRVIRLKAGKPSYIYKGDLHPLFPDIYDKFREFIKFDNPYSLFHGHHYDGGWMGVRAAREFGKPFVENFHSLGKVRQQTQKQYLAHSNDAIIFNERFSMEEEAVRESSVIISLAETEKENLIELYGSDPGKIAVVPGGVSLQRFSPMDNGAARKALNLSDDDYILLFVGRLEWRKGAATLISALRYLKDIDNVKIVIVGGQIFGSVKNDDDVKEYERLLAKAKEEGVEDKVRFIGKVNHDRVNAYYAAADIFVIPSYYEPFGLVALEAMAMRIPVVASRKDGLKATIDDGRTGMLFEPRDPADLARKISEIHDHPELRDRMIEAARREIEEKYSWGEIAEKISDIYRSLII